MDSLTWHRVWESVSKKERINKGKMEGYMQRRKAGRKDVCVSTPGSDRELESRETY